MFTQLPLDVLRSIGLYLDPLSLITLSSYTSKRIQEYFQNEKWRKLALDLHFPAGYCREREIFPSSSYLETFKYLANIEYNITNGNFESYAITTAHQEDNKCFEYSYTTLNNFMVISRSASYYGSWEPPDEYDYTKQYDITKQIIGPNLQFDSFDMKAPVFLSLLDSNHLAVKFGYQSTLRTVRLPDDIFQDNVIDVGVFPQLRRNAIMENSNPEWRRHVLILNLGRESIYDIVDGHQVTRLSPQLIASNFQRLCKPYFYVILPDDKEVLYNYMDDKIIWEDHCCSQLITTICICIDHDCVAYAENFTIVIKSIRQGKLIKKIQLEKNGNEKYIERIFIKCNKVFVSTRESTRIFNFTSGQQMLHVNTGTNNIDFITPGQIVFQDGVSSIFLIDFGKRKKSFIGLFYKESSNKRICNEEQFTNFNLKDKLLQLKQMKSLDKDPYYSSRIDLDDERVFVVFNHSQIIKPSKEAPLNSLTTFLQMYGNLEFSTLSSWDFPGSRDFPCARMPEMEGGVIIVKQRWIESVNQWEFVDMKENDLEDLFVKKGFNSFDQ